jgi:hypothetical protein
MDETSQNDSTAQGQNGSVKFENPGARVCDPQRIGKETRLAHAMTL